MKIHWMENNPLLEPEIFVLALTGVTETEASKEEKIGETFFQA